LQLQEGLLEKMREFFARRDIRMPEKNRIQAYIPAGATALANELGTAPGFVAKAKSKVLIALPGVPSEMRRMFVGLVLPELRESAAGQAVVVRKLRCFGAGESTIAEMLGGLMQRGRNPMINCTPDQGVITLHIIAVAQGEDEARQMAEADEKLLRETLGELVFGTGEQTLGEVVGAELARRRKTLAVAESCTGGMLGAAITAVPGASTYFTGGWVAYSNRVKTGELGVPAELIEQHGAVSEEVARAMARGVRSKAQTDYAIGITGIAGPTGATEQKPVGLVYICVDSDDRCKVKRCLFPHERGFVRIRAVQTALNMLRLEFEN
jgi:nicotinamide-nucleotide amidase